jgi:hypothetical protein
MSEVEFKLDVEVEETRSLIEVSALVALAVRFKQITIELGNGDLPRNCSCRYKNLMQFGRLHPLSTVFSTPHSSILNLPIFFQPFFRLSEAFSLYQRH